jgi:hypothetical protein
MIKNPLRSIVMVIFLFLFLSSVFSQENEPTSRVVEDGGTGSSKALMNTDSSLSTHTIFAPKDLSVFGKDKNMMP